MSNGCNEWVPASGHGVGSGAIYELRYNDPAGVLGPVDPEPFEFVLSGRDSVTVLSVSTSSGFGLSDPTARVIAHESGPALQALPDVLQVPRQVLGDAVLELEELRLCGFATDREQDEARDQELERREEIEGMDAPANPIGRFLERIESVSTGAVAVAGLVLLVLLWPALRQLFDDLSSLFD